MNHPSNFLAPVGSTKWFPKDGDLHFIGISSLSIRALTCFDPRGGAHHFMFAHPLDLKCLQHIWNLHVVGGSVNHLPLQTGSSPENPKQAYFMNFNYGKHGSLAFNRWRFWLLYVSSMSILQKTNLSCQILDSGFQPCLSLLPTSAMVFLQNGCSNPLEDDGSSGSTKWFIPWENQKHVYFMNFDCGKHGSLGFNRCCCFLLYVSFVQILKKQPFRANPRFLVSSVDCPLLLPVM